jgi:hypothetical protein
VELPRAVILVMEDKGNPGAAVDNPPIRKNGNVRRIAERPSFHSGR